MGPTANVRMCSASGWLGFPQHVGIDPGRIDCVTPCMQSIITGFRLPVKSVCGEFVGDAGSGEWDGRILGSARGAGCGSLSVCRAVGTSQTWGGTFPALLSPGTIAGRAPQADPARPADSRHPDVQLGRTRGVIPPDRHVVRSALGGVRPTPLHRLADAYHNGIRCRNPSPPRLDVALCSSRHHQRGQLLARSGQVIVRAARKQSGSVAVCLPSARPAGVRMASICDFEPIGIRMIRMKSRSPRDHFQAPEMV